MPAYRFLTTWLVDAPREAVWDTIYDAERWPEWWRGVERTEVVGEQLWRSGWRPAFAWNHHRIMRWGGEGLARELGG
jgi:uncharacterized protein YndB with AHSA1/START domain